MNNFFFSHNISNSVSNYVSIIFSSIQDSFDGSKLMTVVNMSLSHCQKPFKNIVAKEGIDHLYEQFLVKLPCVQIDDQ